MRLLVVEDDKDLNRQIVTALENAGYAVDKAFDGEEGLYLGEAEPYDAVILDLGLPKVDGVAVLQGWRRAGKTMPVLILTARDRWSDKVSGFDAGADDYVVKPFHIEELLARVRALLRRAAGHATSELVCGPVRLDTRPDQLLCHPGGQVLADQARLGQRGQGLGESVRIRHHGPAPQSKQQDRQGHAEQPGQRGPRHATKHHRITSAGLVLTRGRFSMTAPARVSKAFSTSDPGVAT